CYCRSDIEIWPVKLLSSTFIPAGFQGFSNFQFDHSRLRQTEPRRTRRQRMTTIGLSLRAYSYPFVLFVATRLAFFVLSPKLNSLPLAFLRRQTETCCQGFPISNNSVNVPEKLLSCAGFALRQTSIGSYPATTIFFVSPVK